MRVRHLNKDALADGCLSITVTALALMRSWVFFLHLVDINLHLYKNNRAFNLFVNIGAAMLLGCQPRDILVQGWARSPARIPGARIPREMCAMWDRQIHIIAELSAILAAACPLGDSLAPLCAPRLLGVGRNRDEIFRDSGGTRCPHGL